jgi:RimJ/RimL family protein N-acetyltransferase
MDVQLREVTDADVPVFYAYRQDEGGYWMAAFAPRRDRDEFIAHWDRVRRDETTRSKAIVVDGQLAGDIGQWIDADTDNPEVGYWIAREFWGRGVATKALAKFLEEIDQRPIYAHVASDNVGSRRVLEKCGFALVGEANSFSAERGEETRELIFELRS